MRQYAGFGSPQATNERYKFLLSAGQQGLSCAFDLPTQMGYDPDHPKSMGEVGRVGVSISSLADMRVLFEGIPLEKVTTSMTINATAPILLILYELVAQEQGVALDRIGGTVQNDILKEYIARGTYIFPPKASMRLATETIQYCTQRLPAWNPVSISGYHMREAGSTAVQEVAFTLANGIAYVQAAIDKGLSVDSFAPRLSFFFSAHNNLFEEVAKFRAARRMWFRIMTEQFGATDPRSARLRFHTQTAGSTLAAQQPELNMARVTVQALAATLGGTQSLHTNAFDEALGLPSEKAARLALRTQQVLAHECGITDTADPLGGSYMVERLTDDVEEAAWDYLGTVEELGGAVAAVEAGFFQGEIERAAYKFARGLESGDKVVVGVNRFADTEESAFGMPALRNCEPERIEDLRLLRSERNSSDVQAALSDVTRAARGEGNVLPSIKAALSNMATLGEITDALAEVFGRHDESRG